MHRRYRPIGPQKYYLLTNATNFAGPHLFTDMAVYTQLSSNYANNATTRAICDHITYE